VEHGGFLATALAPAIACNIGPLRHGVQAVGVRNPARYPPDIKLHYDMSVDLDASRDRDRWLTALHVSNLVPSMVRATAKVFHELARRFGAGPQPPFDAIAR
jgi:hypothetical protein